MVAGLIYVEQGLSPWNACNQSSRLDSEYEAAYLDHS
jgi:hypothetical protein